MILRFFKNKKEEGVSLVITLFITGISLSIVFGISSILLSQNKAMNDLGDSVGAFYMADSGIEQAIYFDRKKVTVGAITAGSGRGICNILEICGKGSAAGTTLEKCCFVTGTDDICNTGITFLGDGCAADTCNDCLGISFITQDSNLKNNNKSFKVTIKLSTTLVGGVPQASDKFQSYGKYNSTGRAIEIKPPVK